MERSKKPFIADVLGACLAYAVPARGREPHRVVSRVKRGEVEVHEVAQVMMRCHDVGC